MGIQRNEYSYPWLDEGEVPPLPFDRDSIHIISQGVADPVFDYDIVPLTYTDSRWMAFVVRADINDMKHVTPEPIHIQGWILSVHVSFKRLPDFRRKRAVWISEESCLHCCI